MTKQQLALALFLSNQISLYENVLKTQKDMPENVRKMLDSNVADFIRALALLGVRD